MASIAFDSSDAHDAARPPISLHPAFPAVVALWFAALLGLGSMVLPVVLLERAVDITGLASLVPAASPPLGFMARGLIALASAVAGAALGVAIARRVSRTHDAARPSRVAKFARGARRPIDVHEELGGEGLVNGFGLPINRRRALAIAEDDRPSDFLYMAPLPGNDAEDHALRFDERPLEAADEPFELDEPFEDPAGSTGDEAWHRPTATDPDEDAPMSFTPEFQAPSAEERAETRQEFRPAAARDRVEPLPFSAPSLARQALHAKAVAEPVAAIPEPYEPPAAVPEPYEPMQFEPAPAPPEPQPFRGDWTSAPLGELGLVQLVQRLGASLERRREWLASMPAAAPAPLPGAAAAFEPAPAEEAAQAMAAWFGKPVGDGQAGGEPPAASVAPVEVAPRPSLHQPWPAADDDDDETDAMPSFTLPLRNTVSPTIAFEAPAGAEPFADEAFEDAGSGEPDESYSSLLEMRNPFAPRSNGFVRIDEPEANDDAVEPAVVFPGHRDPTLAAPRQFDPPGDHEAGPAAGSHTAPADADAALRAALATLQRMSGTA